MHHDSRQMICFSLLHFYLKMSGKVKQIQLLQFENCLRIMLPLYAERPRLTLDV